MTQWDRQMSLDRRIQEAEKELFAAVGAEVEQVFIDLPRTGMRVRVLSQGGGPPVLLMHGVTLSAAAWAPLFAELHGFRLLAVDLPGHGLSDPVCYQRGRVRAHAHRWIDDILDELGLDCVPIIGHSLGGMFALWHAAAGSKRISELSAVGVPAVALAGVRVRMPLSLLTVRGLGVAVQRAPSPLLVYRRLLEQGLGSAEVRMAPEALIETLRLSACRPENARTVASLMHAIDHFRRPRAESVLSDAELAAIRVPTLFVLGSNDPYLSPREARPSIGRIPTATVHEMPAGHGPWLVDPAGVAGLIAAHIHPQVAVVDGCDRPGGREF
ncbi:MAG TPA: alpha/beta hydrolase [Solirubrobacteraceae bacterium]|jgi:pimeloyl-ACP methyl ester carboxylesterase